MRTALATLLLCGLAACATRAEVEQIVLSSNAAMVGPWIERPGNAQDESWPEAVDRIERLIAEHPDQAVLVNHLRVRQAMLLTVNLQGALATEVWNRVDPAELRGNARDRALYAVRSELVWTYRALPPVEIWNVEDREFAERAIGKLRSQKGPDEVRDYFRIVAAQIAIKRANSMPQATEEDLDRIGTILSEEAKAFIANAPDAAVRWADGTQKEKNDTLAGARAISSMRGRVWFDEVVRLYEREAHQVGRPLDLAWTVVVRVRKDGAPVPDAVVTIHSKRHAAHRTKTDESGAATITSRVPGKFRVRAASGPDTFEKTLEIGHGVTVNVDLESP
ncbi:MAG: carboxypeptidase-like regulatory domain-containing protein [Planctomycetota bacterium]